MESGSKGFSKDEQLKPSMDFNYLKNEGLEYIQKLSGGIWTDYNDHDPGVTILEQLCYALTDLTYRTDYEVEKLLVDAKTQEIDGKKNAFYSPRMIFSRHPVTIIDFRKLIIDRYNEVQNVWIYPKRVYQREECLSGIFEMVILPSYWLDFEEFKNFETSYIAWRDAKINNNQDLKVNSLELAKELKTLKSRREVL